MTRLKAGLKLKSIVCDAEVMVIKAGDDTMLTCGGVPMFAANEAAGPRAEPEASQMGGCQVGKRYVNKDQSLEILCVKTGKGSLAADGEILEAKVAKKLPSSD